jgi:hypothetical protein
MVLKQAAIIGLLILALQGLAGAQTVVQSGVCNKATEGSPAPSYTLECSCGY